MERVGGLRLALQTADPIDLARRIGGRYVEIQPGVGEGYNLVHTPVPSTTLLAWKLIILSSLVSTPTAPVTLLPW